MIQPVRKLPKGWKCVVYLDHDEPRIVIIHKSKGGACFMCPPGGEVHAQVLRMLHADMNASVPVPPASAASVQCPTCGQPGPGMIDGDCTATTVGVPHGPV